MLNAELLNPDETIRGQYNVEIARWSTDRWVSTIPPLYAAVTQQRLFLSPQVRKRYDPAIIPGRSIANAEMRELVIDGGVTRSAVTIRLKQGYQFNLFVSRRNCGEFVQFVRTMASLPPTRDYAPPLTSDAMQKLIHFLEAF